MTTSRRAHCHSAAATALWLRLDTDNGAIDVRGIAIGAPLALGAGRSLGALPCGIGAANPLLLGGAALALIIVGAGASAFPAWRASRIDPAMSLRAE